MKLEVRYTAAFSLVEVTLALGIAGFCLVAIFGLLPIGLNTNKNSIEQTAAAGLARAIVSDLRATSKTSPPTTQNSPSYQIPILGTGTATHTVFLKEDGSAAGATASAAVDQTANPTQNPRYRVMLTFVSPNASIKAATNVRIFITWPALADSAASTGSTIPPTNLPTNYAGSYEVLTALDRN